MFIYFPEYVYRTSKLFFDSTFPKINKNEAKLLIQKELRDDKYQALLIEATKRNIKLPQVNFNHCIKINQSPSYYDKIENSIDFCLNKVKDYQLLLDIFIKEMLRFYDYNLNPDNKEMSLNDVSCSVIRGCRIQIQNSIELNNLILIEELTRRCSYSEDALKKDLQTLYENEDIFDISKRYIDSNFHRCFNKKEPFEGFYRGNNKTRLLRIDKSTEKIKLVYKTI
jgi:hypothetical protein